MSYKTLFWILLAGSMTSMMVFPKVKIKPAVHYVKIQPDEDPGTGGNFPPSN